MTTQTVEALVQYIADEIERTARHELAGRRKWEAYFREQEWDYRTNMEPLLRKQSRSALARLTEDAERCQLVAAMAVRENILSMPVTEALALESIWREGEWAALATLKHLNDFGLDDF